MTKRNATSSIRRGLEYQDYWGLKLCRDWLIEPTKYRYIQFETAPGEPDSLRFFFDDIICQNEDGSFDIYQIKHRQNPLNSWTWDNLLIPEKVNTSSLIKKWSSSVTRYSGRIKTAFLVTDAIAGEDISIYEKDHIIDIANIKAVDSDLYSRIKAEIGTDDEVTLFFEKTQFLFAQKSKSDLKDELFESFYENLKATKSGVNNLLIQIQEECSKEITAHIDLDIIRKWCEFDEPRPLNENFEIPSDFEFFNDQTNKDILDNLINDHEGGVKVIIGKPGVGKSVYLSKLSEELQNEKVFTIKHHFHLSPEEANSQERLNHERVIEALKAQLKRSSDLGELANQNSKQIAIREFINRIAQSLYAKDQTAVIIIDGLDHVLRYTDEEELKSLLQEVCFPQPGLWIVLGMQPHIEKYLPQIIIDKCPKDNWIEIKGLSLHSVSEIIKKNAIGLNLPPDQDQLNSLIEEIYHKTTGNSLHLRYTLKQLQLLLGSIQANSYSCKDLVPYGGNIETYYELIWRNTSDAAKTMLLLVGSVNFTFIEKQLIECSSFVFQNPTLIAQALRETEHLLSLNERKKISVYHNSFELFLKNQFQKDPQSISLKSKVKDWLNSSKYENLKWSELRIIEHELGDNAPILSIDKTWLIEAISNAKNPTEISRQMKLASKIAFDIEDFSKALEISHLHTYYLNSKDFVEDAYTRITHEALTSSSIDFDYIDLSQRTDSALALLAETAEYKGDSQATEEIIDILIERLQWQEYRLGVIPQTTATFLKVIPYDRKHKIEKVYRYITGFRDLEISHNLFRIYAKHLLKLDQENNGNALLQHELTPEERRSVLHQFAVSGFKKPAKDLSVFLNNEKDLSLFSKLYVFLKNGRIDELPSLPQHKDFPQKISEHDSTERSKWKTLFYEAFLIGVLSCLYEKRTDISAWITAAAQYNNWAVMAMKCLLEASSLIADELKAKSPTFSTTFKAISTLDELIWPNDRDRLNFKDAFGDALENIFKDLCLFRTFFNFNSPIELQDYSIIVSKPSFFNQETLLDIVLDNGKAILDKEVFTHIKKEKGKRLTDSVATLSERAVAYAKLAKFSRLFSDKESFSYLTRSVDNLLGHGYHKDIYLYDVVEVIEYWLSKSLDSNKADEWIRRSARLIERVGEYTDGDETGSLYLTLADLLAKHRPKILYKNYYDAAKKEELRDAEGLFERVLKSLNFDTDQQINLASTALEKDCYLSLQEISQIKTGAQQALDIIHDYLGDISYKPDTSSSSPSTRSSVLPSECQAVTPENLSEHLTTAFENNWERNHYLSDWIAYWLPISDPENLYRHLKVIKEKNNIQWVSYDLLDSLYPLAYVYDNENAFDLLVEAHINDHGWERRWTEKVKAVRRWSFLKEKFPGRYIEFFQKSTNNHIPLSRGVEFFLFFEDVGNADALISSAISFAESLVADIKLDTPAWIDSEEIDDLDLLIQRIIWPSSLVRERATTGLAEMLCTSHQKVKVFQRLLTWIQSQKMESVVAIGLLPIIKAFSVCKDRKSLSHIDLASILDALPFSTVVIDKLIEEIAVLTKSEDYETTAYLGIEFYENTYSVSSFFEKYISTFLAPIYLTRAKKIPDYKGKNFVKQWAFIADKIAEDEDIKFNANQGYYYSQHKGADLLRGFSSKISEAYRSAFLRVLYFYYTHGCVPQDFYLEYAYATLPVELSRWKIGINRCPTWWPKFKIDPDQKKEKDKLLQLQLKAKIEPSVLVNDKNILVAAEGAIEPSNGWKNDPMHTFSLIGFGYKVIGKSLPSPKEVIDALDYHSHLVIIPSMAERPFHFLENKDNYLISEPEDSFQIKDLIIYPLISREKDLSIGLWQYFRDFFDGLNLRPELTEGLNLTLTKNSWTYTDKSGSVYAEHSDWVEGLKERYDHDLPIPYGDFLTINKNHLQDWARQNHLRIGHVLRITNTFKQYSYDDTQELESFDFINVSSIITS